MYFYDRFEWGVDESPDGERWPPHETRLHACGHRRYDQVNIHVCSV